MLYIKLEQLQNQSLDKLLEGKRFTIVVEKGVVGSNDHDDEYDETVLSSREFGRILQDDK